MTAAAAGEPAPLGRVFFARPVLDVARDLVGAELEVVRGADRRRVRLVETEAYGGRDDPASHAGRGPTPRSAVMHGPAGYAYVYLIYGMHHCLNLVTGPEGEAGAVLLRAAEPVAGVAARPGRPQRLVCAGPGRLCRALGLDLAWNGVPVAADLPGAGALLVRPARETPRVAATPRVGIRRAARRRWRFVDADSASVSR